MYKYSLARCKSFQSTKRGELCRIPGSSVSAASSGAPIQIRLPHVNADVFRQFLLYVYTGKVEYFVFIYRSESLLISLWFIKSDNIPRFTCIRNDDAGPRYGYRCIEDNMRGSCYINVVCGQCMHIPCSCYGFTGEGLWYVVYLLHNFCSNHRIHS